MKIIHRYGPCIGITLLRLFRWKVELWFAPGDYSPEEHTHPNSDSEFWVLYASHRYIYKRKAGRLVGYNASFPSCLFHTLTVRADEPHRFMTSDRPMIWLCLEHWKAGVKPTSVAEDFHIA